MSRVIFIAPVFEYEPILVPALRLQTHPDWLLLLIHDGPNSTGLKDQLESLNDPRIRFYETPSRFNDWGHSLRHLSLRLIAEEAIEGQFIVVTNGDNYYAPGFLEIALAACDQDAAAVCCGMAHNHHQWTLMRPELRHTRVDCGCLLVRREVALAVGWKGREHSADWTYIAEIMERYGADRVRLIENVLFVHN